MKWWGGVGLAFLSVVVPLLLATLAGIISHDIRSHYQTRRLEPVDWLYLFLGSLLLWSAWQ